jgi:ATP-binding protein involved in chromosome partitioning
MLGLSDATPRTTRDDEMRPREGHGVKAMSMGFVVDEDDPVIWRGPLVDDVLAQLFDDVAWGDLDYLVVDMPPGTGDAHLSLVQHVPVTGAVVVTTPQPVAAEGATRALTMFTRYDVPVLGLVENMTAFECPDCGGEHDVFGSGGAAAVADQFDVPVLGRLPLDPAMQSAATGPDDADGHSLPILGSLSLPRFREERERATHRPPVVVRDDAGAVRDAARVAATRVAARADAYATR